MILSSLVVIPISVKREKTIFHLETCQCIPIVSFPDPISLVRKGVVTIILHIQRRQDMLDLLLIKKIYRISFTLCYVFGSASDILRLPFHALGKINYLNICFS